MPFRISMLAVLLFSGIVSRSQTAKIDSLKNELGKQKEHTRFGTLQALAWAYADRQDPREALAVANHARALALATGDSLQVVKAGRMIGQFCLRLDRTAEATDEFEAVLQMAGRNGFQTEYVAALNDLAGACSREGKLDKSLKYYFEVLRSTRSEGRKKDIAITLNHIGDAFHYLADHEKALDYYKLALASTDSSQFRETLLIHIGLCYIDLRDFKNGAEYIHQGLSYCQDGCTPESMIQAEFGLGVTSRSADSAAIHLQRSYELAAKKGNIRYQVIDLLALSELQIQRGDYREAELLLTAAERIGVNGALYDLNLKTYEEFAEIYRSTHRFELATYYQSKYIEMKDSLQGQELYNNLMRIHSDFEELEHKSKIENQEKLLSLNRRANEQQLVINSLIGVVAVVLLIISVMLLMAARNKKRIKQALDRMVFERTGSLEKTLTDMRRNQAETEQFILTTKRDIQGPVGTIRGLSSLILADAENPEATRENVRHLQKTIDGLMELQRRLKFLEQASEREY